MANLRMVLQVFKEHQLFAKCNKFMSWLTLVAFLGHIISSEGIEVNPKKTEAVKNWPRPLTPTNIQSFFGIDRYYRRFLMDLHLSLLH